MEFQEFFFQLLSFHSFGMIVGGTVLGIVVGAIPGINGPLAIALLLPVTYPMNATNALLLLSGIYMGSSYGGSIASILLNCPGTGEASCTALDGYPMAKQGKAKEALLYSIFASSFGGFWGCVALVFFTPVLANVALRFGPAEMLLLALGGLTIVSGLTGKSAYKGVFAVCLGIMVSLIGVDTTSGVVRFTMGFRSLRGGVPLIPLIAGFFAIAEMVVLVGQKRSVFVQVPMQHTPILEALCRFWTYSSILIKSTIMGIWIGILPGTGGAVAAFMSYGEAKRQAKNPETFGQGNPEGIIAPEAANNSAVGGALIPLLALGIPGSATAAIMYGALTMHGLMPGPKLLVDAPQFAYTFMVGTLLTVFVMAACGIWGVRLFSQVLRLKVVYIIPAVLAFSLIGVYSVRNNMTDLLAALVFGCLGVLFRKLDIPVAPIILGHILGPIVEENLRRTMVMSEAAQHNIMIYIATRPICLGMLCLAAFMVLLNLRRSWKKRSQYQAKEEPVCR